MPKIVFLKRAVIKADDGQLVFGQEGQIADMEGDGFDAALAAGEIELADDEKPAKKSSGKKSAHAESAE